MKRKIAVLLFMCSMLAGCSHHTPTTPITTAGNGATRGPFHPPKAPSEDAVDLAVARRAAQQRPESGRARFDLGMAYYRSGSYQDAIPELRNAIRILPKPPVIAYPYLAYSLEAVGQPQAAVSVMTELLARPITPEDQSKAFLVRGNTLWACGRVAEAKSDYQSSLAAYPQQGSANYGLGIVAVAQGERREATRRFQAALRLGAKPYVRAAALTALGELAEKDGNNKGATDYFRQALVEDKENTYAASGLRRVTSP